MQIKDIRWYVLESERGRESAYQQIDAWQQPPSAKLSRKPRVVITLVNRGPTPTEGVLLRYAMRALLANAQTSSDGGVWTVPFWLEERRVPWIKSNQIKEVPIDSMLLATYLKKIYRAGYWPRAISIQAMLEARQGDILQPPTEKELSISWTGTTKKSTK